MTNRYLNIKYFQNGKKFNMPSSFVKSCKEFVEGNDHLKTFIQERCEKNSSYSVKTSELLSTFNEWATEMSVPLLNCRTMKKEMGQKGYVYKKIGVMSCIGIRIKPYGSDIANI